MAHYQPTTTVIDDEMLLEAVMEQRSKETGRIVPQESIEFCKIPKLQLAFRNILKIGNLCEFIMVTKLELNNNAIKKIEGLGRLRNLTWLNLSFNEIEQIEGLETLGRLEYLNLLQNNISVIENMDALEELNLLSIANNKLDNQDNLLYLRKFKKLRSLNVYGNPLSEDEDYRLFIAAYFPQLHFLDYEIVDDEIKKEANSKYWHLIGEMREKEIEEQKAASAQIQQEKELQLHRDAFVEFLNGPYLFESLFTNDPYKDKLHRLPGVDVQLKAYADDMTELCMQMFNMGVEEHNKRVLELNTFFRGQNDGITDNQLRAAQMVSKFEQQHPEMFEEFMELSDADLQEVDVAQYSADTDQLFEGLMKLEFELVTQLEDTIKTFTTELTSMVETFSEAFLKIMQQCRELEDGHHQKMMEITVTILRRYARGRLAHMPSDLRLLFEDRVLVVQSVEAAHESHLQKLSQREDVFVTRVKHWREGLLDWIQDKEMKRNHNRVSEIYRYMDYLREKLERLQ